MLTARQSVRLSHARITCSYHPAFTRFWRSAAFYLLSSSQIYFFLLSTKRIFIFLQLQDDYDSWNESKAALSLLSLSFSFFELVLCVTFRHIFLLPFSNSLSDTPLDSFFITSDVCAVRSQPDVRVSRTAPHFLSQEERKKEECQI